MSESKGLSLAYPIGEFQKGGCGGGSTCPQKGRSAERRFISLCFEWAVLEREDFG